MAVHNLQIIRSHAAMTAPSNNVSQDDFGTPNAVFAFENLSALHLMQEDLISPQA